MKKYIRYAVALIAAVSMLVGCGRTSSSSSSSTQSTSSSPSTQTSSSTSPVVEKVLSAISVKTAPSQVEYNLNEKLALTGGAIEAVFTDGSKQVISITSEMVSSVDMATAGEKVVTVSYKYGSVTKTTTFSIRVKTPEPTNLLAGIDFGQTSNAVRIGSTLVLKPVFSPATFTNADVIWESSDPSIATVNENGFVTAISYGNVIITATSKTSNEVKATIRIYALRDTIPAGPSYANCVLDGNDDLTCTTGGVVNTAVAGIADGINDLLIAASVGNDEISFTNLTVRGTVRVQGGGSSSVIFNNSRIAKIIADKAPGVGIQMPRIEIGSTSTVGEMEVTQAALLTVNSMNPLRILASANLTLNSSSAIKLPVEIKVPAAAPSAPTIQLSAPITTVEVLKSGTTLTGAAIIEEIIAQTSLVVGAPAGRIYIPNGALTPTITLNATPSLIDNQQAGTIIAGTMPAGIILSNQNLTVQVAGTVANTTDTPIEITGSDNNKKSATAGQVATVTAESVGDPAANAPAAVASVASIALEYNKLLGLKKHYNAAEIAGFKTRYDSAVATPSLIQDGEDLEETVDAAEIMVYLTGTAVKKAYITNIEYSTDGSAYTPIWEQRIGSLSYQLTNDDLTAAEFKYLISYVKATGETSLETLSFLAVDAEINLRQANNYSYDIVVPTIAEQTFVETGTLAQVYLAVSDVIDASQTIIDVKAIVEDEVNRGKDIYYPASPNNAKLSIANDGSVSVTGSVVIDVKNEAELKESLPFLVTKKLTANIADILTQWLIDEGRQEVVDLNDHTISSKSDIASVFMVVSGANTKLTVQDTSENADGKITHNSTSKDGLIVQNGAQFEMTSGTYELAGTDSVASLCVYGNRDKDDRTSSIASTMTISGTAQITAYWYGLYAVGNGAVLNVKDEADIYASHGFAISGNGNAWESGTTINISGGTIISGETAIYHPQDGTLNITSGEITGVNNGIQMKSGTLSVSGEGTVISASGAKATPVVYGNGSIESGAAISFITDTVGYTGVMNATISGGTITSEHSYAILEDNATYYKDEHGNEVTDIATHTGTIEINGGTITGYDYDIFVREGSKVTIAADVDVDVVFDVMNIESFKGALASVHPENDIKVSADMTLDEDATIKSGDQVFVEGEKTLTINETLINNGTLINQSEITMGADGTFTNNSVFKNLGFVTGSDEATMNGSANWVELQGVSSLSTTPVYSIVYAHGIWVQKAKMDFVYAQAAAAIAQAPNVSAGASDTYIYENIFLAKPVDIATKVDKAYVNYDSSITTYGDITWYQTDKYVTVTNKDPAKATSLTDPTHAGMFRSWVPIAFKADLNKDGTYDAVASLNNRTRLYEVSWFDDTNFIGCTTILLDFNNGSNQHVTAPSANVDLSTELASLAITNGISDDDYYLTIATGMLDTGITSIIINAHVYGIDDDYTYTEDPDVSVIKKAYSYDADTKTLKVAGGLLKDSIDPTGCIVLTIGDTSVRYVIVTIAKK